ncbi:VWA domain-containing protein [Gemmata sp. JC673]|uniref:VWA domain-containing protein n=1 Tax=Gemmata algarum TaxID=2975278 RepID=A0ABU5FD08_9BACT|nr:VWA domain-containing protein [Gemmata algarum]MDY3563696.1 VWA domain-containing protein [Gemmata algarum]
MSRFGVRGRRLLAGGVPAVLLAVLVGCGPRDAERARAEAERAEATALAERVKAEQAEAAARAEVERAPAGPARVTGGLDERLQGNIALPGEKGEHAPGPVPPGFPSPAPLAEPASPAGPDALGKRIAVSGGSFAGVGGSGAARGGENKPAPRDGYNAQNAEAYGRYQENEFRSPLVAPLSTFSADVNTASYANVRRMLNERTRPPASAVFLAEFVNYFPYSYAPPAGADPVAFHVEVGPCPWNAKHHLLRVGVQAHQIPAEKLPPRNLVFLIDTSGSMQQENRLPLVQKSLELLVEKLAEKDRVSVVTYAGDSRVALPPTSGADKKAILDVVTGLQANGSTNGEGGIKKAYQLARDTFLDGGVNRVILCTDGDFNVGVVDNGELVKLIEEQRKSKVFLTVLGYGMGNYKDDRLKELANHGNGHHAYIDTLDEAKKVFVEQGGALVCVAKDVKFQIDFNPAKVTAYRLVGYENRLLKDEDFKNDAKDAGDVGSGHQVTVLYEIVPPGVKVDLPEVDASKYQKKDVPAPASDEWLTVKMRYKHPDADVSKELTAAHKGAVTRELSDDFRFAAAVASFGMLLRDSKYKGAMTYAGVLEEAQGALGADPNNHRKQFLELVRRAKELASDPKPGEGR